MKLSYSTPSTMYIVTIAASTRNSSLPSDAWNASAGPLKRVMKLSGKPMSPSALRMSVTALPRDAPGARLNEIVVAGNWPRWLTSRGEGCTETVDIADSGTCPEVEVDDGR